MLPGRIDGITVTALAMEVPELIVKAAHICTIPISSEIISAGESIETRAARSVF